MQKLTRSLSFPALLVVIGSLLLAACGGGSSESAPSAPSPMPARSGTYAVGHDTVTIPDPITGKTITADLWYPAVDGSTGTPARYSLLPTAYFDSKVAIEDAPINTSGSFPFVVYSHGSGGQSFVASFLTEDIASHGYVVLSANHAGNTAADQFVGSSVTQDQNDFLRPNVVKAQIDWALAQSSGSSSAYPKLKSGIDANRIGLVGHSYGGYTVLATAGGHTGPAGTITPDPRIKAVVGQAPYTRRLSDAELIGIKIPVMLMVGTKDTTTPLAQDSQRPFDLITGPPVVLAVLTDAAHQSFTDVCMYLDEIPKLPDAPALVATAIRAQAQEGCGAGFMPYERDMELSSGLTVAFLNEFVAGTPNASWFSGETSTISAVDITISIKR
ncbi:MAG: CocE/NonD family hydrolase [Acidimicrobiales bacterium]